VTAVAAGGEHTVGLKTDGSVVAWGMIYDGTNFVAATVPPGLSGVTAIAAGNHTVALRNDGSVVTWGDNRYGLANVPVAAQSGVVAIAAGAIHTVALRNDGSVVAWGNNDAGKTNVPLAARSGVIAIAAGGNHTVALKNDGSVVAWGDNRYGQTTVPVAARTGVTAIAAGGEHTVALIGTALLLLSLNARPSGNGLILSWSTNAVGFTLQSTFDLTPPVTWVESTNGPAVIGTQFTLTNTTSGSAQFYRLRKL